MSTPWILVVEPDAETRHQIEAVLQGFNLNPITSGSVQQALEQAQGGNEVTAVIADWTALILPRSGEGGHSTDLVALRNGISRLRASLRARANGGQGGALRTVPVIVTTVEERPGMHAAAIGGGADAYLRATEALDGPLLLSYLDRFDRIRDGVAPGRVLPDKKVLTKPSHRAPLLHQKAPLADVFGLPVADLRNADTGRWDARRVAVALGEPLTALAEALGEKYPTVARTSDSERLQAKLAPFANVVAILRQTYDDDQSKVLAWLRHPQEALKGTPLDALMRPQTAPAVEQWLTRLWLGEPE